MAWLRIRKQYFVLGCKAPTSMAVSLAVGAGEMVVQPSRIWRCNSNPVTAAWGLQGVGCAAEDPEAEPPPLGTNMRPARSAVVNGPLFHFRNLR